MRVGDIPQGDKEPVNLDRLEERVPMRELIGDGSFGGPYQVEDSLMDLLFQTVVDDIVDRLDSLRG